VASGGRDLERALGGFLALDVLQVGPRLVAGVRRGLGPPQGLQALEVVDQLKQILRRKDRHVGGSPSGFRAARGGADEALAESVGPDGRRQNAGHRRYRAVERQFSQHAEAFDRVAGDRAGRRH